MRYPYVLMDADYTLFDFDRAERAALADTLGRYGVAPDGAAVARYRTINNGYWARLEAGQVDKADMLVRRFREFFACYGLSPDCAQVNAHYLAALGRNAFLLPGALELCRQLHARGHRLFIVTNGTAAAQGSRFRDSGLEPLFSGVFISECIGAEKPQPAFFEHVFAALGHPPKDQVIILGDSLASDMAGGRRAGITTCWFSPEGAPADNNCDHVITRLEDFAAIAAQGRVEGS